MRPSSNAFRMRAKSLHLLGAAHPRVPVNQCREAQPGLTTVWTARIAKAVRHGGLHAWPMTVSKRCRIGFNG
jgi:hypothetical protein